VTGVGDEAQLAELRRLAQRRLQLLLDPAVESVLRAPDAEDRAGDLRQGGEGGEGEGNEAGEDAAGEEGLGFIRGS
jgi:hypothetical protein